MIDLEKINNYQTQNPRDCLCNETGWTFLISTDGYRMILYDQNQNKVIELCEDKMNELLNTLNWLSV